MLQIIHGITYGVVIHVTKKYKFIRDSVYGDINLNEFEVKVMDMPQFQRIRRIKQLGLINLIYPGANHSRFEHCVGTMYLASKLATKLNLSKDEIELARISGLLHDIGHGPFSHVSEGVLSFPHEELTKFVIEQTSMHDLLDEKFDTKEIGDIIQGKGKLGPIISGELDVDRMDYLLRDSHNTGVAYGVIDYERIISNLTLEDGLVLDIKGVQPAEGALVSRYFMYPSVYQQNRLDNRIIPKRVKTIRLDNFKNPEKLYKIDQKNLRKAEEEIAEDYNMDKNYVFINIAEYPRFSEMKTQVNVDNKLYPLTEISNIIGALSKARFNIPDISVYVPIEEKERFGKLKLEHYLDLPEVDREKFHGIHYDQIKLF